MRRRQRAARPARERTWRATKSDEELMRIVLAGQGRRRPPRRSFALQGLEREVACVLSAGRTGAW